MARFAFFSAVLFALLVFGCGGSQESGDGEGQEDAAQPISGADAAAEPTDGGEPVDPRERDSGATTTCGNGVVEPPEQCDDGNEVEDDGCTLVCAYTCDDDADCGDGNPCNGQESCSVDHTCSPDPDPDTDGEPCGDNMSCHEGECLEHICGNGVVQADEQCDDGDTDEANGCTTDCRYSCGAEGEDARECDNDCDLTATCDETTHACIAGDPLADGTLCGGGEGYCLNGVCTLSNCGDGNQEPNEECDLGDQNGAPDSGCSAMCTLAVCGDGEINGMEHCDDGNTDNLDGCDSKCRAELTYRGRRMDISMEPAPDFCKHANSEKNGNAFADLFPDTTLLDMLRPFMSEMMESGRMLFLFHVLDVDDYSFEVEDPLVRLGMSVGLPDPAGGDWANTTDKLDFPALVYREFYDDQLRPLFLTPAELVIEDGRSIVRSTIDYTAGFELSPDSFEGSGDLMPEGYDYAMPEGEFTMYNVMMQIENDPSRSRLKAPPETVDSLLLPETSGGDDPDAPATGIMCGAMHSDLLARMPLPNIAIAGLPVPITLLCLDQAAELTACGTGESPEDGVCNSVLDLLKLGCSDLGIQMIAPLGEPDADTDDDGVNDGYSMVMRIASQRIRVVGFAEGEPPGKPIVPE